MCSFDLSHLRSDSAWAEHSEQTRAEFLQRMNDAAPPGIRCGLSDDRLMHRLESLEEGRALFESIGLQGERLEARLGTWAEGVVQTDFPRFAARVAIFKDWFHKFHGSAQDAERVRLFFGFDELINAGALPAPDGEAVLINYGISNVQKWCMHRQFMETHMLAVGGDVAAQSVHKLARPPRLRRLLARLTAECAGYAEMSREYLVETFITEFAAREYHGRSYLESAEYEGRVSNWDTAEAFLLCHELGHIYLGHTQELREWVGSTGTDERLTRERAGRRREMEFEADAFALPYAAKIQAVARQADHDHIRDPTADPRVYSNVVLPVLDLFTIMHIAHKPMYDEPGWVYPTSVERFERLFPGMLESLACDHPSGLDPLHAWHKIITAPLHVDFV